MTFESLLCEDVFVTLGRADTLRHAYRVYLWRRVRGLIDHSHGDEAETAGADFCSLIDASPPAGSNMSAVALTLESGGGTRPKPSGIATNWRTIRSA
jgi:hypothetical protein